MDRISQLPDSIIHHILSFLNNSPPKQLVRMSVLSKTWFHLTASFPVLNFNICEFRFITRKSFYKYVDYTTSRFCHHNVTAHRLTLIATIWDAAELRTVNRCLELVSQNGVTELDIGIDTTACIPKYPLANMLVSFSMLKSLSISGCELPYSLMVDVFKFKSLIRLKLHDVYIDDEGIKYLTTSCPLLQVLSISYCDGFKSFCLYGHQNLQQIKIKFTKVKKFEKIDIEAPNLSHLTVEDTDMNARGPPLMNLKSCKNLTTVTYSGHPLPHTFLSNFPFIKNLNLFTEGNNLKFLSHSLRTLVLHSHSVLENSALENIEFSTPNLVLFIYSYDTYRYNSPIFMDKRWPLLRDSTHLRACMHFYPQNPIQTFWFKKLRLFMDKKNVFKARNLYISAAYFMGDLEDLKKGKFLRPYELEHVELQLDTPHDKPLSYISFVETVLWCFRPQSLTLRSPFPSRYFENVVEFTYEKLLEQEDQRHTKIQIVSPSSSEDQKHFMDLKSLSMALPYDGNAISFIKEKVNEEEAESQWYADMEILRNDFGVLSVKTHVDSFW